MNVFIHDIKGTRVAEVQSEGIMIRSARDAADTARELLASGIDRLMLHERNLCPEFWQPTGGLAGVILQEFASKSVVVALVGKLDQNKREYLTGVIQENGVANQAFILDTVELAKARLSTE